MDQCLSVSISLLVSIILKRILTLVVEISPIVDSSHYKFKRHYTLKIIKNFKELNNFLAKIKTQCAGSLDFHIIQ